MSLTFKIMICFHNLEFKLSLKFLKINLCPISCVDSFTLTTSRSGNPENRDPGDPGDPGIQGIQRTFINDVTKVGRLL